MIQRKRKALSKIRRRRVTIRTLFLLSLTLIFNTYAWFLYATTVSTNMTVHVNAWKVEFGIDDTQIEREFPFDIENAYPGMQTISRTVNVQNYSDEQIDLDFEIVSVRIFDTVYTISETPGENIFTSEQMMQKLQTEFPFHIIMTTGRTMLGTDEGTSITLGFSWGYEENSDDVDTQYGIDAYNYYQENPDEPAISIVIKICAVQHFVQP